MVLATTTLCSGAAIAEDYGPWQVRFRAIIVQPDESSSTSIGGFTDHSTQIVPEMDISYFFNENISLELILAVIKHQGKTNNTAIGDLAVGGVWLLPPTLTLQYHVAPGAMFNPYFGAGVNYTIFFSESLPAGSPLVSVDHSDSFGFALQSGVDIQTGSDWFLNLDVKKVWIQTDATLDAGALGIVTADVSLDPWVFGVGVGRRF
ncbi:MAG: hypothetical protein COA47_03870 [Robiginitomaculum sp.]|nr:MAG: hypothetical protein COA47_03870 [Robiginitomaculum sp.]